MPDIITFLDNNRKPAIYTGENIHGPYRYLVVTRFPTKLNSLDRNYPSSHCRSLFQIEDYFQIMWNKWKQGWHLHHMWP